QSRTQKSPDRNVAHHLLLDRRAEPCANLIRQVRFRAFEAVFRTMFRRRKRQVPVLLDLELTALPERAVACRKLANSLEHRQRIGHPEESQVLVERLQIHACFDSW